MNILYKKIKRWTKNWTLVKDSFQLIDDVVINIMYLQKKTLFIYTQGIKKNITRFSKSSFFLNITKKAKILKVVSTDNIFRTHNFELVWGFKAANMLIIII